LYLYSLKANDVIKKLERKKKKSKLFTLNCSKNSITKLSTLSFLDLRRYKVKYKKTGKKAINLNADISLKYSFLILDIMPKITIFIYLK
jgi:hypothetical protein